MAIRKPGILVGSFAFPFLQIFPIVERIFPPQLHPIGDQAPAALLAVAQGAVSEGFLSHGELHRHSAPLPPSCLSTLDDGTRF